MEEMDTAASDPRALVPAAGLRPARRKDDRIHQVLECGRPLAAALSLLDVEILRARFGPLRIPEATTPEACANLILAGYGIIENVMPHPPVTPAVPDHDI